MPASAALTPAPPSLPGLAWRSLTPDDLPALTDLAQACLAADGGLAFLFAPEVLTDRYFPDAPGAAIGAFGPDGRLAAGAAVRLAGDPGAPRARLLGQVHPDYRRQGLGAYLLRWGQAQAQPLLAGAAAGQALLELATESLTDAADHLFRAHGFTSVFEELVMRRDLRQPLPNQPWPPGVTLTTWQMDVAEHFYQAYYDAFRARPGFPGWTAAEWIGHVTDNDLRPAWSLLAYAEGVPAGFVIGTIDLTANPPGGYVWQIGVVPAQRRRGLATGLLAESMRRMQAAGAPWAGLVVHVNNPGAIQAYAQLGFAVVGRRARYHRTL